MRGDKKPKQPPLAVALKPDRSQMPIGSYATVAKKTRTREKILLRVGARGVICADKELKCKPGEVGFTVSGGGPACSFAAYLCVPIANLEIDRPKR